MKDIINKLTNKIYSIVLKGDVKTTDDSKDFQELELSLMDNDPLKEVINIKQFGFASNPPKDTSVLVLCNGGDKGSAVVIGSELPSKRLRNLDEGDSAIYSDPETFVMTVSKDGKIHLKAKKIEMDTPTIKFKSNNELLSVLSDICDLLSKAKTSTALPVPLQPLDMAPKFLLLKEKLEGMKL